MRASKAVFIILLTLTGAGALVALLLGVDSQTAKNLTIAGVGVLILAAIPSTTVACMALVVLAVFTAVSMTLACDRRTLPNAIRATKASRPTKAAPIRASRRPGPTRGPKAQAAATVTTLSP